MEPIRCIYSSLVSFYRACPAPFSALKRLVEQVISAVRKCFRRDPPTSPSPRKMEATLVQPNEEAEKPAGVRVGIFIIHEPYPLPACSPSPEQ